MGVPPGGDHGFRRGAEYFYRLENGEERPDPASRCQPYGVHGPTRVMASDYPWTDDGWAGLPLCLYVIYELHVGVYTPAGTFAAIADHLDRLKDLGITALEIMPVAAFPGNRNWGYDGVYPFAVQDGYGGADGFKYLVDQCHQRNMAVILDVVYNHLGPEGNYLGDFGPYFTDRYRTPWGEALNFDGPQSDGVRDYFIQNALYWITEFHVDALRLDAVHSIKDFSARPFLGELAREVDLAAGSLNRRVHLIAESIQNDRRLVDPPEQGGMGLASQWNDDFHHAVHAWLTGERNGYYIDFGRPEDIARTLREGFFHTGRYSRYRQRRHGVSADSVPGAGFVIYTQNHDQVGNRMSGERLSVLVSFSALKLAAGLTIFSPFIPLLFMGEEYGETAPFPYFVSHGDSGLIEAVRKGRREEFARFDWKGNPPDPQDENTFLAARLNHDLRDSDPHGRLQNLYTRLLRLRRECAPLARPDRDTCRVELLPETNVLVMKRWTDREVVWAVFNLARKSEGLEFYFESGSWRKIFDSQTPEWGGPGATGPGDISGPGKVHLKLTEDAFVLYQRSVDGHCP